MAFKLQFLTKGQKATQQPDPRYPTGMEVDMSYGRTPTCQIKPPYPAVSVGTFHATCDRCGLTIAFTVAGRVDDPKLVTVACNKEIVLQ